MRDRGQEGRFDRAASGRPSLHQGPDHPGHRAGARCQRRVPGGGDQVTDAQVSGGEPQASHTEHETDEQRHQHSAARDGTSVDPPHGTAFGGEAWQVREHAPSFPTYGACRGDGLGSAQHFGEPIGDLRLDLLIPADGHGRGTGERPQEQYQQRDPQQKGRGGPHVDDGQGDKGTERREQSRQRSRRGGGDGARLGGVGGEPGGQITGREGCGGAVRVGAQEPVECPGAQP